MFDSDFFFSRAFPWLLEAPSCLMHLLALISTSMLVALMRLWHQILRYSNDHLILMNFPYPLWFPLMSMISHISSMVSSDFDDFPIFPHYDDGHFAFLDFFFHREL